MPAFKQKTRPAASNAQEVTVGSFLAILAGFVGTMVQSHNPEAAGAGEVATAGTFLLGNLLASWIRDRFHKG